jgi:hypothetical protein
LICLIFNCLQKEKGSYFLCVMLLVACRSEPSVWTMGLLKASDWQARWTGLDRAFAGDVTEGETRLAARYFRKEFESPQKPEKPRSTSPGEGCMSMAKKSAIRNCRLRPQTSQFFTTEAAISICAA